MLKTTNVCRLQRKTGYCISVWDGLHISCGKLEKTQHQQFAVYTTYIAMTLTVKIPNPHLHDPHILQWLKITFAQPTYDRYYKDNRSTLEKCDSWCFFTVTWISLFAHLRWMIRQCSWSEQNHCWLYYFPCMTLQGAPKACLLISPLQKQVGCLTTEWSPWLHTSWKDIGYERSTLVWKTISIRQPERLLSSSSYNHNSLTILWASCEGVITNALQSCSKELPSS